MDNLPQAPHAAMRKVVFNRQEKCVAALVGPFSAAYLPISACSLFRGVVVVLRPFFLRLH